MQFTPRNLDELEFQKLEQQPVYEISSYSLRSEQNILQFIRRR